MSEFLAFVAAGVIASLQAAALAPERPELGEPQLKSLREKNIFSPFRTKPFPPKASPSGTRTSEPAKAETPARPKPPVLTGIVYDAASKGFQAIVEDKNPAPSRPGDPDLRLFKEPKFLKAGEEVAGVTIEAVEKDKVVVLRGETRKELAVGEPLPEDPAAAPAPAPSAAPAEKVEARPVDPAATNSVLEELRKRNKKKDRTYDEP